MPTAAIIAHEVSSEGNPSTQETKERRQCLTRPSHRSPAVSSAPPGDAPRVPCKESTWFHLWEKEYISQHFCYRFLRQVGNKFKGLNSHLLNEIPCGKSHVTLWIRAPYLGSEIKNITCPLKKKKKMSPGIFSSLRNIIHTERLFTFIFSEQVISSTWAWLTLWAWELFAVRSGLCIAGWLAASLVSHDTGAFFCCYNRKCLQALPSSLRLRLAVENHFSREVIHLNVSLHSSKSKSRKYGTREAQG